MVYGVLKRVSGDEARMERREDCFVDMEYK